MLPHSKGVPTSTGRISRSTTIQKSPHSTAIIRYSGRNKGNEKINILEEKKALPEMPKRRNRWRLTTSPRCGIQS
jgi:hypothetical protein